MNPYLNPSATPLLTDLYELTMLQGYLAGGMHDTAVFEFFIRKLPERRGFLLACGLETLLDFVEQMRFSRPELEYLASTGRFSSSLIDYLGHFRFSGDIEAMPEGTVFFENEPVVRVTAPLPEAQLLETRLINILHFEIMIASKAARCTLAAGPDRVLVDFGLRRAHAAEAGLLGARASFIAGFAGSSNVLAGERYGIPIFGTMAHSFIEAHDDELQAFLQFARANPANTTLLVDTYDTIRGAEKAVKAAEVLRKEGIRVQAVRLDSGDLLALSKDVRGILDRGGLEDARIFASGNIDEDSIRFLLSRGAPIDGFGVGTRMNTSADAPYLDSAYKMAEYAGKPRFKTSTGKVSLPGRKQVFRVIENGSMMRDRIVLEGEETTGRPLLKKAMEGGRRLSGREDLRAVAKRAREDMSLLPEHLKSLETKPSYPVEISERIVELRGRSL